MATNHDILSHRERISRLTEIQRELEVCKRICNEAFRKFNARMATMEERVSYKPLWDSIFADMTAARQLAQQAKVDLDLLLATAVESVTYYPFFTFRPILQAGKGGIYSISFEPQADPTKDFIRFKYSDGTYLNDPLSVTGNTYSDDTSLFMEDDLIYVEGATNAANNGVKTVDSCTADAVTVDEVLVSEASTEAVVYLIRQNIGT